MDDLGIHLDEHGSSGWEREQPATARDIEKLTATFSIELPEDYLDFLICSNGAYGCLPKSPGWCELFSIEQVIDCNRRPSVGCLPNLFVIGTNGDEQWLCFRRDDPTSAVYTIKATGDYGSEELVAPSFRDFACSVGKGPAQTEAPIRDLAKEQGWQKAKVPSPIEIRNRVWFVELDKLEYQRYHKVVVFYWAPWSGPAAVAWRLLTSRLSVCKLKPEILLINADTVKLDAREKLLEIFGKMAGAWGETCWISDGSIVGQDYFGAHDRLKIPISPSELITKRIEEMGLDT